MFSSSTFSSKATCCYSSIQIIWFASEGQQRATTKTDVFIASHKLCLGQKVALLLRDKHVLHLCINEQVVVVCICPSKRETRRPRTADIQTFFYAKAAFAYHFHTILCRHLHGFSWSSVASFKMATSLWKYLCIGMTNEKWEGPSMCALLTLDI